MSSLLGLGRGIELGLMRVSSVHYVDFNKRLDGMSLFRYMHLGYSSR